MYNLPYFKEVDGERIKAFMQQHTFAMLIGTSADQSPVATQLPFLLKERDGYLYLQAHMMQHTDHHKAFLQNNQALVVFTGPHTYVSASWYTQPEQASTWNYMSVHARGELSWLDDQQLYHMLEELTTHYENNDASPASYKYLPEGYINRLAKAIVAFEIKVTDIQHVFKLSQNKDQQSFLHIIEQLKQGDADAMKIALEMEAREKIIFPHE